MAVLVIHCVNAFVKYCKWFCSIHLILKTLICLFTDTAATCTEYVLGTHSAPRQGRHFYVGSGQASYQRFSCHLNCLKRSARAQRGSEVSTTGGGAVIPLRRWKKQLFREFSCLCNRVKHWIEITSILNFKWTFPAKLWLRDISALIFHILYI